MFHLRTRRRRWVVAATAALTLLGGGVFLAMPAQAATTVRDGFEGNPYVFWQTVDTPGDSIVWLGNHKERRTGTGAAVFDAPYEFPARIHRQMTVDRPPGGPATCYAEAWAAKVADSDGTPRVRMGIRLAGTSEGVFLDISTYNLTNTTYQRAGFATFPYQVNTPSISLIVDISVTAGEIFLDDVAVSCTTDIG